MGDLFFRYFQSCFLYFFPQMHKIQCSQSVNLLAETLFFFSGHSIPAQTRWLSAPRREEKLVLSDPDTANTFFTLRICCPLFIHTCGLLFLYLFYIIGSMTCADENVECGNSEASRKRAGQRHRTHLNGRLRTSHLQYLWRANKVSICKMGPKNTDTAFSSSLTRFVEKLTHGSSRIVTVTFTHIANFLSLQ